ncbi:MAG: sirohydrochlorin chelatase [Microbacterium sp.]|uniref:sirohydrochlorin chelatase n=1 Tax=Microbacterium sp. TaxID=51671 RepID=UPI003A84CAF8
MSSDQTVRVVLVGGHESAEGADLTRFALDVEGAIAASPGRAFHNTVSAALAEGQTVVVVPMTFGRNPTMVADTAKTLKWLAAKNPGRLALAAPFGQLDHLTAWLRTAANAAKRDDPDSALLIVAGSSNPFDEAELHRTAYLVATHGALDEVGVAIADDDAELAASIARLRRLGAERIFTVPAGFAATLPDADAEFAGALMSDASVVRVIHTRVREALAALVDGHDGIDDGLMADHGHGYAHSHAFEEGQGGHTHSHGGHAHSHNHNHAHTHAH